MQNTTVSEYEVFRNSRDALAFFFYRAPALDATAAEGPFWFSVQDGKIRAGTEDGCAVFESVDENVLKAAQKRGVIMLVEFENQQPLRCTPCYISQSI